MTELEKEQLKWGIEISLLFLEFIQKSEKMDQAEGEAVKAQLTVLQKNMDVNQDRLFEGLNASIDLINEGLKKRIPLKKASSYSPFPKFSFASQQAKQSGVLDQIDMIERTLTEAVDAGFLKWEDENPMFLNILKIFTQVEKGEIKPEEGMIQMDLEIKKINKLLSQKVQFPSLVLEAYEII